MVSSIEQNRGEKKKTRKKKFFLFYFTGIVCVTVRGKFMSLKRSEIFGNEVRSSEKEMKQRKKNNSHGEQ